MKEPMDKKKKLFIAGGIGVILLSSIMISLIFTGKDSAPGDGGAGGGKDDLTLFDPNMIPTYQDLRIVMDKAVEDIFGESYSEALTVNKDNKVMIPNTQISFQPSRVGDSLDAMATIAMAFKRNPYALNEEHPESIRDVIDYNEDTLKELPDGTSIDLANLVEDYTDIKLFVNRDEPYKFRVEGYSNQQYFEETVDLFGIYEEYYAK